VGGCGMLVNVSGESPGVHPSLHRCRHPAFGQHAVEHPRVSILAIGCARVCRSPTDRLATGCFGPKPEFRIRLKRPFSALLRGRLATSRKFA
jgi:hypothetical protein